MTAATDAALGRLVALAHAAHDRAYAPYSGFRVGAAVLGTDGTEVAGCNVENAAYPSGICAERAAIAGAVAQGVRTFEALVLYTDGDEPTPPCGMCRQVLVEIGGPDLPVISVTRRGGEARWTAAELLPTPFTPTSLRQG